MEGFLSAAGASGCVHRRGLERLKVEGNIQPDSESVLEHPEILSRHGKSPLRSPGGTSHPYPHRHLVARIENAFARHVGSSVRRQSFEELLRSVMALKGPTPRQSRRVGDPNLGRQEIEELWIVPGPKCLVEAMENQSISRWHLTAADCTTGARRGTTNHSSSGTICCGGARNCGLEAGRPVGAHAQRDGRGGSDGRRGGSASPSVEQSGRGEDGGG